MKYYNEKVSYLNRFKWKPYSQTLTRTKSNKFSSKHKRDITKEGMHEIKEAILSVEEFIHKKVPFKNKLQRRHKTFVIYRLMSSNGMVFHQYRRVKIKEFQQFYHLNPKENKTNKIVGYTPDYVGFRPGYKVDSLNPFNLFCRKYKGLFLCKTSPFYSFNELFIKSVTDYREVWSGSPDTNSGHLKSFLEPNSSLITVEEIVHICSLAPSWFSAPIVDYTDPSELFYSTNFNPDAFPGHVTSKILRANNKGYSNPLSVRLSKELYTLIRSAPMKNHSLWDLFAREKDIKVPMGISYDLTTRCVLTTEEFVTHFLGWIFQKFMLAFENNKTFEPKFHIQGEYNNKKANNLVKKSMKYQWVIETDWSKFDSTIDTEYLIAACCIMFSPSCNTPEDFRMFFFVMSSVITKNIIIPPGVVVELNRGNPSGHPGVTAINCFVNLIRWAIIGYEVYGPNYEDFMDIEVYGDDADVFLIDHPNLNKIDIICNKYKFKTEPNVGRFYPTALFGYGDLNTPDFLKRYPNVLGISWNIKKIFDKLLYPSKRRSIDEHIQTAIGFVCTAPFNDLFNRLIKVYLKYCKRNFKLSYDTLRLINNYDSEIQKAKNRISGLDSTFGLEGLEYELSKDCSLIIPKSRLNLKSPLGVNLRTTDESIYILINALSKTHLNRDVISFSKKFLTICNRLQEEELIIPPDWRSYQKLSMNALRSTFGKLGFFK